MNALNRHVLLFGTLSGSFGHVTPLPEKVFRRLHMLEHVLSANLPHYGGLNPKSSRLMKGIRAMVMSTSFSSRNMIDGNVIWEYTGCYVSIIWCILKLIY